MRFAIKFRKFAIIYGFIINSLTRSIYFCGVVEILYYLFYPNPLIKRGKMKVK